MEMRLKTGLFALSLAFLAKFIVSSGSWPDVAVFFLSLAGYIALDVHASRKLNAELADRLDTLTDAINSTKKKQDEVNTHLAGIKLGNSFKTSR